MSSTQRVPFVNLAAGYRAQRTEIDRAVARVLAGGWYILGQEVSQFEAEFAAYHGRAFAVGAASGTDALLLALQASGVGPGDEVITPAHTAVATAAAVVLSGARPVFVDVDALSYTLNPAHLAGARTSRTKAVIAVHLYGHAAAMAAIEDYCRAHDLVLIEDCAQAHGARYHGRLAGSMGNAAAFSFYPTKNLGAAGDGGAILCDDAAMAGRLRSLRQYGWRERYVSEEVGHNSRLDELQAAILRLKLERLAADNAARRAAASLYDQLLADTPLRLPHEAEGCEHVYHLYVVQAPQREALRQFLAAREIGTAVHYPVPIHLQPAYVALGRGPGSMPVSERLADGVLSLPMFPQISAQEIEYVGRAVRQFYGVS